MSRLTWVICVSAVQGKGLTLAMSKDEVVAWLGDRICDVKTLDDTHLYCEPPEEQPLGSDNGDLPRLKVSALVRDTTQFSSQAELRSANDGISVTV